MSRRCSTAEGSMTEDERELGRNGRRGACDEMSQARWDAKMAATKRLIKMKWVGGSKPAKLERVNASRQLCEAMKR